MGFFDSLKTAYRLHLCEDMDSLLKEVKPADIKQVSITVQRTRRDSSYEAYAGTTVDFTDTVFITSYDARLKDGRHFPRQEHWSVSKTADAIRNVERDIPDNIDGVVEDRVYDRAAYIAEYLHTSRVTVNMCGLPYQQYKRRHISRNIDDFTNEVLDSNDIEAVHISIKCLPSGATRLLGLPANNLYDVKYEARVKEGKGFRRRRSDNDEANCLAARLSSCVPVYLNGQPYAAPQSRTA
ncbi:hypothetical protein HY642_04850 [Candidatus Woesearchaeota archaeon]|nr:hypothetical protein [Candidatus Woesearchaeota archaeon]